MNQITFLQKTTMTSNHEYNAADLKIYWDIQGIFLPPVLILFTVFVLFFLSAIILRFLLDGTGEMLTPSDFLFGIVDPATVDESSLFFADKICFEDAPVADDVDAAATVTALNP